VDLVELYRNRFRGAVFFPRIVSRLVFVQSLQRRMCAGQPNLIPLPLWQPCFSQAQTLYLTLLVVWDKAPAVGQFGGREQGQVVSSTRGNIFGISALITNRDFENLIFLECARPRPIR
jgi:hypothetical protein